MFHQGYKIMLNMGYSGIREINKHKQHPWKIPSIEKCHKGFRLGYDRNTHDIVKVDVAYIFDVVSSQYASSDLMETSIHNGGDGQLGE